MRALFLDRDGVLTRDSPDYIRTADALQVLDGVPEAIARACRAGWLCVVITNQSGIGRGLFTEQDLRGMNARLVQEIEQHGGHIERIYWCPHTPAEDCACRKPKPGLVLRAADELGITLAESWFVGDKASDILCGAAAGCRTVLVLSGQTRVFNPRTFGATPDAVGADMPAAVDFILQASERGA